MKRTRIGLAAIWTTWIWARSLGAQEAVPLEEEPVYLAIIWHQHQPLYLDPNTGGLSAPWVRTHATKDYFDMAHMHRAFPQVHATINLTSSLLLQLERHYVEPLGPYLRFLPQPSVDADAYLADQKRAGTDPWIDLALTPTHQWPEDAREKIAGSGWSARAISGVILARWPRYQALAEKAEANPASLTGMELRELLAFFYVAHFDPDFLHGSVRLTDGTFVDLSDLVEERTPAKFWFREAPDLALTNRLVAESARVITAVVPEHRDLRYDPSTGMGQLEIVTTPFYHPILPLLADSELARHGQPRAAMPPPFAYPADARHQVESGAAYFEELFGSRPDGFWPAEGSVAESVVSAFAASGVRWIATDQSVLERSTPPGGVALSPYRVDEGRIPGTRAGESALAVFFRHTGLSDRVGFSYQDGPADGEASAEDLINGVREAARGRPGALITVILDGENAWEHYVHDPDGKAFLAAFYRRLESAHEAGEIRTVTPIEYLQGNPGRGVPAHPLKGLPEIEPLWAGSWIGANFSTWIGEPEENRAWEALGEVRAALERSGLPPPSPGAPRPRKADGRDRAIWEAWHAMWAAEGSDWFWWYGVDQDAGASEVAFDRNFRALLASVGRWARVAGASMPEFSGETLLEVAGDRPAGAQGVMARVLVPVVLTVRCEGIEVADRVFVVGSHRALGDWQPNLVPLADDGAYPDALAGDSIWSLEVPLPAGVEVEYKYTNSGTPGAWGDEEFPGINRRLQVPQTGVRVEDQYGKLLTNGSGDGHHGP